MNRTLLIMIILALVLGATLGSLPLMLERGGPGGGQTTPPVFPTTPGTTPQTTTWMPAKSYDAVIRKIVESLNFFAKAPERWVYEAFGILTLARITGGAPSYSRTNVQVVGIDEHDFVKNDGRYIYVLRESDVAIVDGKELSLASRIRLSDLETGYVGEGLYLVNDTLVVLASKRAPFSILRYNANLPVDIGEKTLVIIANVSDPRNPVIVNRIVIDGGLKGSRLAGRSLHVVTQLPCFRISNESYAPVIPQVNGENVPPDKIIIPEEPTRYYVLLVNVDIGTGNWNALALMQNDVEWIYMSRNRLYVAGSLTNYIMDTFYVNYKKLFAEAVLSHNTLNIPPELRSEMQNLADKGEYDAAIEKLIKYISGLPLKDYEEFVKLVAGISWAEPTATQFSVVEVLESGYEFRGSFKVEGEVLDQFAIEEFERNGKPFAIIATTVNTVRLSVYIYRPSASEVSPRTDQSYIRVCDPSGCYTVIANLSIGMPSGEQASVTILPSAYVAQDEPENRVYIVDAKTLDIVSSLRGIAKGERVYSARIRGDIFYLVTYRQVDPLFAIDISDPLSPKILGYLKVPGFSEYLHPITSSLILGVGYGEARDMKISLFDVSDPANPKEIAFISLKGWSPVLENDYHAFTYDERYMTCYIPVMLYTSYYGGSGLGALVIRVDPRGSLEFRGFLQHGGDEYLSIYSRFIRVAYIDDVVFTITSSHVKAWDMRTLEPITDIPLG